ncbi:hypothetical protein PAXINDRAFT_16542 [Paxillus involutus ATCC 200175]|uniref:Uncharacterized protein n=1 Tax=Paxillus involutus ATCC 200175 TaxID=664439 RepID=A0A0C9TRL0_PAXIN|nr:hypothetical protein PAXINDRAFT_16542 [Paxillus involutus ATCC 200175]
MKVENECEDARREIRDASVGSIETIGQTVEAQDGNLNSLEVSLINESEENPEPEFLLENGVGPALNENARDIVEALERVHLMQYDLLEQAGVEEQGGCDLMNEDNPDVLRKHGELMKKLKKRKRPDPLPNVSSPETSPSKRRRVEETERSALMSIDSLPLDDGLYLNTSGGYEGPAHSSEFVLREIIMDAGIDKNEDQERTFRIVGEHFVTGD